MIPTFTVNDLFVMMQTLNAKTLIGFTDPFKYFTKQEIEKEWEITYKKLHKLELIDLVNGEVKLEEAFSNALWIMSRTNLTVEILTDWKKKSLFYFGNDNVLECSKLEDGTYTLYMHGSPGDTWNNVIYPRMLAGVQKQKVQSDENILISTSDYIDWLKNGIHIESSKLEKLNENRDLGLLTRQLKNTFQHKIHNNRLMIFYKEDFEWSIEGLHVLTSPTSNWIFKMINEGESELLEGKQSTSVDVVIAILDVLRRVKKENEPTLN